MRITEPPKPFGDLASQLCRLEWDGSAVLAQDPAGEWLDPRKRRFEDAVGDRARIGERAMNPPRRVVLDGDPRHADGLADLPRLGHAMCLDIEVRGKAEIALPPRREADVAAEARNAERANPGAHEILPDDVPDALVEPKRVWIDRALGDFVALRRPVVELDRALLGDRVLELGEPPGELGRVVGRADADAFRGAGRRVLEAGSAEREVLQREPQWLRVRELAFEAVERGLERGELVVVEVEPVEEVVLRAKRVQLLAGELVALRRERNAKRGQLRTIRVVAARECLVRHLRVALDVRLDVAGCQRPPLRHEEGDERELTDQLVRVVRHRPPTLQLCGLSYAATVVRSRCWCEGQ